ncbi:MAG: YceI family protein [Candidatus Pacebacteria bacterium]|nr:YceI family protein [Candidatus Paceibacterota bacterium]
MKMNQTTTIILFGLIVIIGIVLALTNNRRKGIEIVVQQPTSPSVISSQDPISSGEYVFTTETSTILWQARKKLIENYVDKGTFGVSGGSVVFDQNGVPTMGTITIALDTLVVTETGVGGGFNGLAGDMLSDRFLDVENHPNATFMVSAVEAGRNNTFDMTGDLTLKGVTQPVTLPVVIQPLADGSITLTGAFEIDRTVFGITFGSDKFFDSLGDKVIDDTVQIGLSLQASKVE